jgi:hypothetical protein
METDIEEKVGKPKTRKEYKSIVDTVRGNTNDLAKLISLMMNFRQKAFACRMELSYHKR